LNVRYYAILYCKNIINTSCWD